MISSYVTGTLLEMIIQKASYTTKVSIAPVILKLKYLSLGTEGTDSLKAAFYPATRLLAKPLDLSADKYSQLPLLLTCAII